MAPGAREREFSKKVGVTKSNRMNECQKQKVGHGTSRQKNANRMYIQPKSHLGENVELLDGDVINHVEHVEARNVLAVAFDDVDQLSGGKASAGQETNKENDGSSYDH